MAVLDLPFVVRASDIPEVTLPGEAPVAAAQRLAAAKAAGVAATARERFVIGADTVVVCGDDIIGKPADAAEARAMLRRLRGREHTVTSGVAVHESVSGRQVVGSLTTTVWMRPFADAEIEAYVVTGDPLDKAGAYAIQHPVFRPVERIEGCYLNVVGLPLCLLLHLLWQAGAPVHPPEPALVRPLCPRCVLDAQL